MLVFTTLFTSLALGQTIYSGPGGKCGQNGSQWGPNYQCRSGLWCQQPMEGLTGAYGTCHGPAVTWVGYGQKCNGWSIKCSDEMTCQDYVLGDHGLGTCSYSNNNEPVTWVGYGQTCNARTIKCRNGMTCQDFVMGDQGTCSYSNNNGPVTRVGYGQTCNGRTIKCRTNLTCQDFVMGGEGSWGTCQFDFNSYVGEHGPARRRAALVKNRLAAAVPVAEALN